MTNINKKWTKEEDEKLSKIVLGTMKLKWKNVAREFQSNPHFPKRTSKECHRRWVNFLDPTIKYEKWTEQEDQILIGAHIQYGNQWALIEKKLPGRPNLFIKNHFYSMMRKGLRKLNKFIKDNYNPDSIRQLSHRFISKVALLSSHYDSVESSTTQAAICQILDNAEIKEHIFIEGLSAGETVHSQAKNHHIVGLILQLNKETRRTTKKAVLNISQQKPLKKLECKEENKKHEEEGADQNCKLEQVPVDEPPIFVYYTPPAYPHYLPPNIETSYLQIGYQPAPTSFIPMWYQVLFSDIPQIP